MTDEQERLDGDEARGLLMASLRAPRMVRDDAKVMENRLRMVARRQGLTLVKSRARDPRSALFNTFGLLRGDETVAGDPVTGYGLTLDQVQQVLNDLPDEAMRTFRAVDGSGVVLGQTTAIDGFAAIAWAEMLIRQRGRPRLSFIRVEERDDKGWKFVFESKIGSGYQ